MAEYIDENLLIEKMTRLRGCSCSYSDGIIDEVEDIMSDLPTTDVIPIPDGATNGDMIKAMFPNELPTIITSTLWWGDNMGFNKDWWNAPYKNNKGV